MAEGGGFFTRLSNLFQGFLNLWISDVEKEHPEIAYENAIGSMIEKYTKLKRATAAIIRRRDEIQERYGTQSTELAQVSQDLDVAVQTRSEERRVGKEGRSRWSPDHLKKKKRIQSRTVNNDR